MISFSPTGTSRRVAEGIAEAFSNEKTIVDLCEETVGEMQIGKEDICIFSAPCYGGRIPQTAAGKAFSYSWGANAGHCLNNLWKPGF